MIVFLTTHAHRYTVGTVMRAHTDVRVRSYDQVFAARTLPAATYIFTDMDRLGFWELELASELYRLLGAAGCRVLNDPARVLPRFELLERLHAFGRNSFRVWRARPDAPAAGYPVFLRTQSAHRGVISGLLETPAAATAALQRAVADGFPSRDLMFVEFRAEPFRPGMFLKQASYRIGDRQVIGRSVLDSIFRRKHHRADVTPEYVLEAELARVRENRDEPEIRSAFLTAEIEYGRVDFALVRGRVEVYEINTNPFMELETEHRSATRRRTLELIRTRILAAIDDLVPQAPARPIAIDSPRLSETRRGGRFRARGTP